jgi:hypothetical protein
MDNEALLDAGRKSAANGDTENQSVVVLSFV